MFAMVTASPEFGAGRSPRSSRPIITLDERVSVLIVEDDRVLADAVARVLALEGFTVDRVASAEQAMVALQYDRFGIAIIDIGLPGQDGLQLVRSMRRKGIELPILILTARDGHTDRANALTSGANDYMTKPFAVDELRARCRALARRASGTTTAELWFGALKLDMNRCKAFRDGVPIGLTQREWAILEWLVLNAGRVVSKEQLRVGAGGQESLAGGVVEEEVSRLRAKLGDAVVIRTIRGLGYRLDDR